MRTSRLSLLTVLATLCVPATASAAFEHIVAPGESLSSVAAADGLTVEQLAAANGISAGAELTAGATLAIPPQSGDPASAASATAAPATSALPAAGQSAPSGAGGYVVQPGDTLSSIAARYGVTVDQLAAANGLDPNGLLLAGATLGVSAGSAPPTATPSPSATASPSTAGPLPSAQTVTPSDVGAIAQRNGVSPSLAEAIADQESGFNNDEVSPTGATGVMQIEPGTWADINAQGGPLAPASADDNVLGGVELLRSLLNQTGGDPALAAAAYYQGLASVRAHGLYADTQAYVNDVLALAQRFGG